MGLQPKFGQFLHCRVCIDSGLKIRSRFQSGICHYLEKLAFNATSKFGSKDEILQRLEKFRRHR